MIAYASRTGSRTTNAKLRAAGWRSLINPLSNTNPLLPHDLSRYALDNGAWSAHINGVPFNVPAFERALIRFGHGADFIAIPDIVASPESLAFSRSWVDRLAVFGVPLMLVVQDGMKPPDVADLTAAGIGIFVGGSTAWKLSTLAGWCRFATAQGVMSHVGRVNTARRIAMCIAAGATSFDGTSVTQFPITLGLLDAARRQTDMFAGHG